MHMAHLVAAAMFEFWQDQQPSTLDAIFPGWTASDRFGIVIDEPFGGLGATQLIQVATTLFYDSKPARRTDRKVYPEIYALHYGRGFGAHAPFDFWPARREAILTRDHQVLLDAINDRGITRLAIPDRPRRDIEHRPKEEDAAIDRIVSAFIYSPSGRVDSPDFSIRATDPRAELNAKQVLSLAPGYPKRATGVAAAASAKEADTSYGDWIDARSADTTAEQRTHARRRREALRDPAGMVVESYRFAGVADALKRF